MERAEKRARRRPRRLDPSRLRLLDAQALGRRPQDRGAGQGPRPVPGARMIAVRSPTDRPSTTRPIFCKARSFRATGRCSSRLTAPAPRSCSRSRSTAAKPGRSRAAPPSIRFRRRCIPMAQPWSSRAAGDCGPSTRALARRAPHLRLRRRAVGRVLHQPRWRMAYGGLQAGTQCGPRGRPL